jgi:hypothetical protein
VPREQYHPVSSIAMEIFPKIKVVLEDENDTPDQVLLTGFSPPFEILVVGPPVLTRIFMDHWV